MLENVQFILIIFIVFYLIILLYDLMILFSKKKEEVKIERKKKELINNINNISLLNRKLKNKKYLYTLGIILEENKDIVKTLKDKKYINLFEKLINYYDNQDLIYKTYYAYILGIIGNGTKIINDFLLKLVIVDSIYANKNALDALNKIKDIDSIIEAFKQISFNNINLSNRLMFSALNKYNGNKNNLCKKAYQNFKNFNEEVKISLINYFAKNNYDIKEELVKSLKSKKIDKELELAIIRYFKINKSNDALELFINRLNDNYYSDFEYEVVLIQTLSNYSDEKVVNAIMNKIISPNYYVRKNAAIALNKLVNVNLLKSINDKYAKEMLDYISKTEINFKKNYKFDRLN